MLLEPDHQRQVVGEAAKEGHRGVGMSVDEAGDERHARSVDHLVAVAGLDPGPELDDHAVFRAKAHGLAVERGIHDRESHP